MAKKTQPEYLDLTEDISFKRYFSSNKQLLFSLLKSFLPISDRAPYMVILNPDILDTASDTTNQPGQSDDKLHLQDSAIPPDTPDGKQVVLDLHVELNSGEHVDIEMQSHPHKDFLFRMLAYWVRLHNQSLKRGQKTKENKPTYSLIFTKFSVLSKAEKDYIKKANINFEGYQDRSLYWGFKMFFVELNRFNKSHLELVDMADRWCYIMKHSADLTAEQIAYLSQHGETKMALEHLEEVSKEKREYWKAASRERREWEHEMRKQGLIEEGIEKGHREIALNMLQKGLEVSLISEVTGLSVAEIKQLKK